jgi:hypothetical protein
MTFPLTEVGRSRASGLVFFLFLCFFRMGGMGASRHSSLSFDSINQKKDVLDGRHKMKPKHPPCQNPIENSCQFFTKASKLVSSQMWMEQSTQPFPLNPSKGLSLVSLVGGVSLQVPVSFFKTSLLGASKATSFHSFFKQTSAGKNHVKKSSKPIALFFGNVGYLLSNIHSVAFK